MLTEQQRNTLNRLSREVVDACYSVHKELGPGLLESVYEHCLVQEFRLRGLRAAQKVSLELIYKNQPTGKFYEIDILLEGEIVLELKAVESMHPVFEAQLLSYLRLSGKQLGFLINFNVPLIKGGIKRLVHRF